MEFFPEFFLDTLLRKRRSKFGKRNLSVQKCHKKRNFWPPNARNLTLNNLIDRSQLKKHLGIFLEFLLHTLSRNDTRFKPSKMFLNLWIRLSRRRQVRRKMTRLVNISEKYIWDFFQNSPFISRSRNEIQNIMKIMILFFIGIVRIQKHFGFLSLLLYTYELVSRRIDQQYSASNRVMFFPLNRR